jgi:hypothetical protein
MIMAISATLTAIIQVIGLAHVAVHIEAGRPDLIMPDAEALISF